MAETKKRLLKDSEILKLSFNNAKNIVTKDEKEKYKFFNIKIEHGFVCGVEKEECCGLDFDDDWEYCPICGKCISSYYEWFEEVTDKKELEDKLIYEIGLDGYKEISSIIKETRYWLLCSN